MKDWLNDGGWRGLVARGLLLFFLVAMIFVTVFMPLYLVFLTGSNVWLLLYVVILMNLL